MEQIEISKNSYGNCVAFVTLSSTNEKNILLKIRKREKSAFSKFCSYPLDIWEYFTGSQDYERPYRILEAPEPEDVTWKFIGYSRRSRTQSYLISASITFLVLFSAFIIQLLIKFITLQLQTDANDGSTLFSMFRNFAISYLGTIFIIIVNSILYQVTYMLSSYEK